jgi:hypothetical protein
MDASRGLRGPEKVVLADLLKFIKVHDCRDNLIMAIGDWIAFSL